MVNWLRQLRSGQHVSYNFLPFSEVCALSYALDEWDYLMRLRFPKRGE